MKRHLLLPFVFALFPIVFLFAANKSQLSPVDSLMPMLVSLGGVGVLFAILRALLSDSLNAAIVAALYTFLFFSYGYLFDAIRDRELFGFEYGRARYLLLLYVIAGVVTFVAFRKTSRDLKRLSNALLVFSIAMILISAFNILQSGGTSAPVERKEDDIAPTATLDPKTFPDIYYLILDAYGNAASLKEFYEFDNQPFLDELKKRGLYVAEKSRSNYAATQLSLASSLNMEHITYLEEVMAQPHDDEYDPTTELMQNSRLSRFLKSMGYTYINFRSIWGGSQNRYADVTFQGGKLSEFSMLLFNTTLFRATSLFPALYVKVLGDVRERTLYTLEMLPEVAAQDFGKPKFVFAHFLPPHPPFVFGPNGEEVFDSRLELDLSGWKEEQKRQYINQLIFTNRKVLALIDALMANSKRPPVIVVQGDHGPWSTADEDRSNNRLYRERMRIFNAYYLPQGGTAALYHAITPVNSFRVVLNHYFKTDLPLLEDRSFFSDTVTKGNKTPYTFTDMTDIVAW
jgi:hypothetical protein